MGGYKPVYTPSSLESLACSKQEKEAGVITMEDVEGLFQVFFHKEISDFYIIPVEMEKLPVDHQVNICLAGFLRVWMKVCGNFKKETTIMTAYNYMVHQVLGVGDFIKPPTCYEEAMRRLIFLVGAATPVRLAALDGAGRLSALTYSLIGVKPPRRVDSVFWDCSDLQLKKVDYNICVADTTVHLDHPSLKQQTGSSFTEPIQNHLRIFSLKLQTSAEVHSRSESTYYVAEKAIQYIESQPRGGRRPFKIDYWDPQSENDCVVLKHFAPTTKGKKKELLGNVVCATEYSEEKVVKQMLTCAFQALFGLGQDGTRLDESYNNELNGLLAKCPSTEAVGETEEGVRYSPLKHMYSFLGECSPKRFAWSDTKYEGKDITHLYARPIQAGMTNPATGAILLHWLLTCAFLPMQSTTDPRGEGSFSNQIVTLKTFVQNDGCGGWNLDVTKQRIVKHYGVEDSRAEFCQWWITNQNQTSVSPR